MKLTSIVGTGSGRLGGSVFAVRNGQQIVRAYQKVVSNPQSKSQVGQRAKLKLASQFSAAMAQELYPYGRDGMLSPRNQFVRDLFERGVVTYANDEATIDMTKVRLTKSRLVMMYLPTPTREGGTLTFTGNVLPNYIGNILGIRVVVVSKWAGSDEPAIAASGLLDVTAAGVISGSVAIGTTGAVDVYAYAYIPTSSEMIARYGNMTMEEVSAVELATSVAEVPSGFTYSITNMYPMAAV